MQENLYQNIDQPVSISSPEMPVIPSKSDPRRRLIIILSSLIGSLLVISLLLSFIKSRPKTIPVVPAAPTPTPTPAIINDANVLSPLYQAQFKNIENNQAFKVEIIPPQVDPSLGL